MIKTKDLLRKLITSIQKKDAIRVKDSLDEILRRKVRKKIKEKEKEISKRVFS